MKLSKFLLVILITILISFSLSSFFYTNYTILGVLELDMKMKSGDVVGLDTNTSVISFGIIPKDGFGQRTIILKNIKTIPVKVYIKIIGEMKEVVSSSDNGFILNPNETKEITFTATPQEKGKYEGKVKFIFTRAS